MDATIVIAPQVAISVVSWLYLVLSMNRYRGVFNFRRVDLWSFLIYVHAGFIRWVAALALYKKDVAMQIVSSLLGSTLAWVSFVIVFNDAFLVPSYQQWVALVMSLVVTALWEVQNRLVFDLR